MLLSLVLTLALHQRAFAFLSYKDTIFAIRERKDWIPPTRYSTFPDPPYELESMGLDRLRGEYPASIESFNSKTNSFNVACQDFDHVMSCFGDPRFPRPIRQVPEQKTAMKALARKLFHDKGNPPVEITDIDVYSVDLDGSGKQVRLVDVWAKAADRHPGIVFLDSPSAGTTTLCYVSDGWPKVLTVADLEGDGAMEVIVGGIKTTGKTVSMWRLNRKGLKQLVSYESP